MATSPPQVNAFLLCDQAFQQAWTGKWCVIGTFGVIWAQRFPVTHSPLMVFVGLSDFSGDCSVEVGIRDAEGQPLPLANRDGQAVTTARLNVPSIPMSVAEFAIGFPPVSFPAPGTYQLELSASGSLLAVRSFRVEKAKPPAEEPHPGSPDQPS